MRSDQEGGLIKSIDTTVGVRCRTNKGKEELSNHGRGVRAGGISVGSRVGATRPGVRHTVDLEVANVGLTVLVVVLDGVSTATGLLGLSLVGGRSGELSTSKIVEINILLSNLTTVN